MTSSPPDQTSAAADEFISRWRKSGGAERANYQLFVTELCAVLGVEPPHPAVDDRVSGEIEKRTNHGH